MTTAKWLGLSGSRPEVIVSHPQDRVASDENGRKAISSSKGPSTPPHMLTYICQSNTWERKGPFWTHGLRWSSLTEFPWGLVVGWGFSASCWEHVAEKNNSTPSQKQREEETRVPWPLSRVHPIDLRPPVQPHLLNSHHSPVVPPPQGSSL